MTIKGFTLVETVITIAMTVVIMLAVVNLYKNFNSLYVYQQTYVATGNAASSAMSALGTATLQADQVLASHVFSDRTLSSATTTLALELPSMDASGNIIAGAHDYIGFYATGTDLYRRIESSASSARVTSTKKVAPLVASISFGYDTADVTQATRLTATIVTKLVTKTGPVQTSLSGRWYVRNK